MQSNFISFFRYLRPAKAGAFAAGAAALFMVGAVAVAEEKSADAAASGQLTTEEQPAQQPAEPAVFATVDGVNILLRDYNILYTRLQRERYYHGKVSQLEIGQLQREVGKTVVDRALLTQEVKRLGAEVDEEELQRAVDESMMIFDERFASQEDYQKDREKLIEGVKSRAISSMRIRDLEKNVRESVVDPGDEVLKAYYQENLELFTQPGQYRLSVILLAVDPSAGFQAVTDTIEEAKGLVEAMRAGNADFAEMAEAISNDKSAVSGGDMGYQHQGMLAPGVESAMDELSVGDISDPIRLLEGVAIFRLTERLLPNVQPYDVVRERVLGLWIRESQDKAWNGLIEGLKAKAKIVVHDDFFVPLTEAVEEGEEGEEG